MNIYRIKLTVFHFFTGEITAGGSIRTSVELKSDVDKFVLVKEREYFDNNNKSKTDVNETVFNDGKKILEEIGKINLRDLKNNYFDDNSIQRYRHWELEYNKFKIVGTYNNMIEEFRKIAKLLGVEEFSN